VAYDRVLGNNMEIIESKLLYIEIPTLSELLNKSEEECMREVDSQYPSPELVDQGEMELPF
jgi:hypothetical protein